MINKILVFCYGSNMSSKRLVKRCPSAYFFSVAKLEKYKFQFNKLSTLGGGSGKGNVNYTGNINDFVYGVIFSISKLEECILDEFEGLGKGGYEKVEIKVMSLDGQIIEAIIYKVNDRKYLDNTQKPFYWYKQHCVIGAEEFKLPVEYIDYLKSFDSKEDPNKKRINYENNIYL